MQANPVRIIGIDPGLRRVGWGIVASEGSRLSYVASGVITPCHDGALAERLSEIFRGLTGAIATHAPREAAIEETFVNSNPRAALKLGQARGAALLAAGLAGLPVAEYTPNAIKKAVSGTGHAAKDQVGLMIRHLLPKARFEGTDEADALAAAICHAHARTLSCALQNRTVAL